MVFKPTVIEERLKALMDRDWVYKRYAVQPPEKRGLDQSAAPSTKALEGEPATGTATNPENLAPGTGSPHAAPPVDDGGWNAQNKVMWLVPGLVLSGLGVLYQDPSLLRWGAATLAASLLAWLGPKGFSTRGLKELLDQPERANPPAHTEKQAA
jgi:hypothetical protein